MMGGKHLAQKLYILGAHRFGPSSDEKKFEKLLTMQKETTYNEKFMARAVELSNSAWKSGKGLPIGCVIVKDGQIIGEGHNEIFIRKNPTAHGEMVAIEDACKNTGELELKDCELYSTLEPCPMCFGAIYWAGIRAVYYANTSSDAMKAGFADSYILQELNMAPEKRKIPFLHLQNTEALQVLTQWKAKDPYAAQPWKPEE
jgi:tRNA(Arg) A34 adenosine deaminase TadA